MIDGITVTIQRVALQSHGGSTVGRRMPTSFQLLLAYPPCSLLLLH